MFPIGALLELQQPMRALLVVLVEQHRYWMMKKKMMDEYDDHHAITLLRDEWYLVLHQLYARNGIPICYEPSNKMMIQWIRWSLLTYL
jgi:hypothetical protein